MSNPAAGATYQEVLRWASSFLEKKGKEAYAAKWLLRERLMWTPTELALHLRKQMPENEREQFERDIRDHLKGLPVQYIVGHEWFYNRKFYVTSATLIPRPETEEWFDRYVRSLPKRPLKVADIGTGSGVLAISHKLERSQDTVIATDISEKALIVARENAKNWQAEVDFRKGDLTAPIKGEEYDVIICNPPYIGEQEQSLMDQSVLDHEPHSALFADNNGLGFYQRLAEEIPSCLKKEGQLFLEIGYQQAASISRIVQAAFPKAAVTVWQDLAGNDRVVHMRTS